MMRSVRHPAPLPTGATLVISLIMLVVLTLLAVTAIRMGNVNFRTIGNMQARNEAVASAQQAIEQVLGDPAYFSSTLPSGATQQSNGTWVKPFAIDMDNDGTTDYTVQVTEPVCLKMVSLPGYSADFAASAPRTGYWDIKAVVTDNKSGARVVVHQGVKLAMDASASCP